MLRAALFLLGTAAGAFAWVMRHDPRTLWSGFSLLWTLCCAAAAGFFLLTEYAGQLAEHGQILYILVVLLITLLLCALALPAVLTAVLFVEGIKVIRHEGFRPANLLTMLSAVLLYLYLAVWPLAGGLEKGALGTKLYTAVSLCAAYVLSLMAVYLLSAALNLLHWKKCRDAGYIVVLGSGLSGARVPPLLAARIDKGIELLRSNPGAVLILSGGQGPGEEIAGGEAMARYAEQRGVERERLLVEDRSRSTEENLLFSRALMGEAPAGVIVVTTAYHVFRALLLARQQGLRRVGFGARTRWYLRSTRWSANLPGICASPGGVTPLRPRSFAPRRRSLYRNLYSQVLNSV